MLRKAEEALARLTEDQVVGKYSLAIGSIAPAYQRSSRPEGRDDIFDRHSFAIVGVNEASFDQSVGADNEGRRNRQSPMVIRLEGRDVPTSGRHRLALLIIDPDRQVQFKGIPIVEIG